MEELNKMKLMMEQMAAGGGGGGGGGIDKAVCVFMCFFLSVFICFYVF